MGIKQPEKAPEWLEGLVRKLGTLLKPLGFIGELGVRYLSPTAEANTTSCWLVAV